MKRTRSLGDIGDGVSLMLWVCLIILTIYLGGGAEMSSDREHTIDPNAAEPAPKH